MPKQVIRVPTVLNDGAHRPVQEAVRRANSNFDELYELTEDAGGIANSVKHPNFGASGDGTTNDRAAILACNDAQGTGGSIVFPPGTYSVQSNLTLTRVCLFDPGAKIKPASGVTITLSGGYAAGDQQQVFDISAGGAISTTTDKVAAGHITPQQLGAVANGTTDDWAAIRAALDSGVRRVYFPPVASSYYSTKCFNIKQRTYVFGNLRHGQAQNTPVTIVKFADNTCGFIIHGNDTNADTSGYNNVIESPATGSAGGSIIEGLIVQRGNGNATTIDGVTHGIRLRDTAQIRHCHIRGFAGNGVHIVGSAVTADPELRGYGNQWYLEDVNVIHNFHGVYVDGNDVNAGYGVLVNANNNAGWGIWDSSFLGNTWVGCHTSVNTLGSYKTDNINARSVFVGCYQEDGQVPKIIAPAIHVGGLSTPGAGDAPQVSNLCGVLNRSLLNVTGVGQTTVTAAGSGYTSAPSVTFDAPTGAATATATATIGSVDFLNGKIVRIGVTSGGAGYSATPTVTVGGDGSGATAEAIILGGIVKSITVTAAGSGYTTAPITVAAPTETTALGTAYIDVAAGTLLHIVVTTAGAGYTVAPGIMLSGGGGTGATATCALSSGTSCSVQVNEQDNASGHSAFFISRTDAATGGGWKGRMDFSTGAFRLEWGGSIVPFLVSAQKSNLFFGRRTVVQYAPFFSRGLYLGANSTDARQIFSATSIPTSGENAKGDFVLNSNISELGSASSKYILLGWSRLTTGAGHVLNTDWLEARCLTGN